MLIVAIVAIVLAWDPNSSILDLVAYAWAGFGAAFGPVVLLALFWRRLSSAGAIAGMIAGATTVVVWGNVGPLSSALYEIVPGFALSAVAATVVSKVFPHDDAVVDEEFTASRESARTGTVRLPTRTRV